MRKPRDIDAELRALMDKSRKLKSQRLTQLGDLIVATGADALPFEALAGILLAAMEDPARDDMARWSERGDAFFRDQRRKTSVTPAPGEPSLGEDASADPARRGPPFVSNV